MPGTDLLLAIDLPTQQAAEAALGERRGAVVAIDPANGDVLALVSHPGFDPSAVQPRPDARRVRGADQQRGQAAAQSRVARHLSVGFDDQADDGAGRAHLQRRRSGASANSATAPSTCRAARHLYREGKGGKHGAVNLVDAVARSCDVYFYGLAAQLGVDRIAAFATQFGIGSLTGIDISGEKPGLLPTPAWKKQAFKRPAGPDLVSG